MNAFSTFPSPMDVTFKITTAYFKQYSSPANSPSGLQQVHKTGPGALLNHTKPWWLSHIPVHPEREDAEKTLHQGDTSADRGREALSLGAWCLRERKVNQRPSLRATQAKELTLQGQNPSAKRSRGGGRLSSGHQDIH